MSEQNGSTATLENEVLGSTESQNETTNQEAKTEKPEKGDRGVYATKEEAAERRPSDKPDWELFVTEFPFPVKFGDKEVTELFNWSLTGNVASTNSVRALGIKTRKADSNRGSGAKVDPKAVLAKLSPDSIDEETRALIEKLGFVQKSDETPAAPKRGRPRKDAVAAE